VYGDGTGTTSNLRHEESAQMDGDTIRDQFVPNAIVATYYGNTDGGARTAQYGQTRIPSHIVGHVDRLKRKGEGEEAMQVVVIGGGFIGQLVQLAIPEARVLDWRKTPPADHLETRVGPQYLWEPIDGVPSSAFLVTTLVDGMEPTDDAILRYKRKIGKESDGGDWGLQFQHEMVGWSSQLPKPRVEYDQMVRMVDLRSHVLGMTDRLIEYDILVSTIPLPALLALLITGPEYDINGFKSDPIYMSDSDLPASVEGMTLDYISDPLNPWYRHTHIGIKKYMESIHPQLGCRRIVPGKIHPYADSERVLAQLELNGCFCFGRFATWRPDELAHQTWQSILKWKKAVGL